MFGPAFRMIESHDIKRKGISWNAREFGVRSLYWASNTGFAANRGLPMTEKELQTESFSIQEVPRGLFYAVGGLVVIVVVAVFLVIQFVETERERDLRSWQARLGIVVDSRVAVVEDWLDKQFSILSELAENGSLQLYVDRLSSEVASVAEDAIAIEGTYLRNLLEETADRTGYMGRMVGPAVNANVDRFGVAGLAVLDKRGRPLTFTSSMPSLTKRLAERISRLPKAKPGLIDLHLGVDGKAAIGFAVPIFSIQGDERSPSDQIGTIIGIKEVAKEMFPLLRQPGSFDKSAESMLVRRAENKIEYLSPLMNKTPALKLKLADDTPNLAAAYGVNKPGGFGLKYDYRNKEVLVISRKMDKAPWTVVYKIDRSEALAASDQRLKNISIVGGLLITIIIAIIVAVWRWGTSVRVQRSLDEVQVALERHRNLAKFLGVMADNQQAEIFAVTREGKYTFANKTAARIADMNAEDMLGKDMNTIIGPVKAKAFAVINETVLETHEPTFQIYHFETEDGEKTYRVGHVPLRADRDYPPGVLMVVDDVTEFLSERGRHEDTQRQLIRIMAMLVDQKDPHAVLHTTFVVEVALGIATALELSYLEKQAIDIVAITINLGKVFVPAEILLKEGNLNDGEMDIIHQGKITSNRLLEGVSFDAGVRDALDQIRERWDGTGQPKGLKEDEIIVTSQVVAVANAFVGMISQRSYRDPIPVERAVEMIVADGGGAYARHVVMALTHYLENHGGREFLERLPTIKHPSLEDQIDIFRTLIS